MKHVKAAFAMLLCLCMMLTGCSAETDKPYTKYSAAFYEAFDTYTSIIGYAQEEAIFNKAFNEAKDMFFRLHAVFDGYNAYEGVHNLYYVNNNAAKTPVKAEKELLDLLLQMKEEQPRLQGRVNVAMGSVLSLWHDYREEGVALPPLGDLQARSAHTNIDDVIINEEEGTVFFKDPELKLDLGAVAKGYAVELVAQEMLKGDMPSFIISAGGNVRCGHQPLDGRARWGVGIQDPDGNGNKEVLYLRDLSIVTSGDYQRFYVVEGERYHHLIDPDTLYPGTYMRSVSIITEDSGMADALSTALFLMPYEEGAAFAKTLEGVEVLWILNDGTVRFTEGLKPMMLSQGASARDQ